MTIQEFDLLTEKYLRGECTPEETTLLEKWAARALESTTGESGLEREAEAQNIESRLWLRLESEISATEPIVRRLPRWVWAVAAACLMVMVGYYFTSRNNQPDSSLVAAHKPGTETRNVAGSSQKVILTDGSVVVLGKNASIVADEDYGTGTRTVYLMGEAFFDIRRNEEVPFLVHSGGLVTEVLGTSFYIKPQPDGKKIEVSVKTGRVSVYANVSGEAKKFDGVILTPNQKVLFDPELKTIRPGIVDAPRLVVPDPPIVEFQFDEATVATVLARIGKAYGVEIVVANPAVNGCAFTGDLNGLPMYKQLDFLCASVGARFEVRGTTIFISGLGCK